MINKNFIYKKNHSKLLKPKIPDMILNILTVFVHSFYSPKYDKLNIMSMMIHDHITLFCELDILILVISLSEILLFCVTLNNKIFDDKNNMTL